MTANMLKNLTESKLGLVDRKNKDLVPINHRYRLFFLHLRFRRKYTFNSAIIKVIFLFLHLGSWL